MDIQTILQIVYMSCSLACLVGGIVMTIIARKKAGTKKDDAEALADKLFDVSNAFANACETAEPFQTPAENKKALATTLVEGALNKLGVDIDEATVENMIERLISFSKKVNYKGVNKDE